MSELFVPYDLAFRLRAAGFTCKRIGVYLNKVDPVFIDAYSEFSGRELLAPLYQQVIDWFKDVHNIHIHPDFYENRFAKAPNNRFYRYFVHFLMGNEWRKVTISSSNGLDVAIHEALSIIDRFTWDRFVDLVKK